ncbi:developmental pluripotency-associated protein 3 [Phodopus roborovskii]|uniref:developmental pluripotency-associated protein 3 n=1 Tax=Phodopus roborovskii TaxID=109678 RepID=UPI0021E35DB5|nr:developmental pluripotency-associated protein 3 [Phodopus roborovskii]
MEEPSEVLDSVVNPDPQTTDEQDEQDHSDDSEVSQPEEILARDLKELTISPRAKKLPHRPVRRRHGRRRIISTKIKPKLVENKSEAILRKVQSAFPRRQVRTLLSVQNDPVARMKRFMRPFDFQGYPLLHSQRPA